MPPKAKKTKLISIASQKSQGLKSIDKTREFVTQKTKQKLFAVCIQETWRYGFPIEETDNCTLIYHGLDANEQLCKRGKGSVAIALSEAATQAWKSAGSITHKDFGDRILSLRLLVKDLYNRDIYVYLVSAYAPVGNADQRVWDSFLENIEKCLDRKQKYDVLVIGCDCNSSLGISQGRGFGYVMQAVGPCGLRHRNNSGVRFLTFLEVNNNNLLPEEELCHMETPAFKVTTPNRSFSVPKIQTILIQEW